MTARASRRIRQPDSRCVPNRNAVLNKKNVVALPRLPLAQRHSAQALGVSASASCRAPAHAQKLIHGSAIKCHGKPHWVNNLQNSNRR
jgi:hypothetical protein